MLFRDLAQQRCDAVEQLELLAFGGPSRRARDRLRHRIGKLGNQPGENGPIPARLEPELIGRGFGTMVTQGLHEWLVRDDRVLVAAPEQDCSALGVCTAAQLRGEPGLANPGLAHDHCDRAATAASVPPQSIQLLEFGGATD